MELAHIETLERLGRLLDEGKISQGEYETLKGDLIAKGERPASHGPQDTLIERNDLPDRYQEWVDNAQEPTTPGWYPDPESSGTRTRFHDGRRWVDRTRKRKPPGWYPHSERTDRERYFDGLEYTHEVRPAQTAASRTETGGESSTSSVAPTLYKVAFGLGIASVFLGSLFGLLAWATVAVGGYALYSVKTANKRWMAWTGLVLGIVYSLMNAYHNGHIT